MMTTGYCGLCRNGAECPEHHDGWRPATRSEDRRWWWGMWLLLALWVVIVGLVAQAVVLR